MEANLASSPHEEYITRHVTGRFGKKSLLLETEESRVSLLELFV